MRKYNQGAFVRVTVSESEAYAFAQRWPGSGLGDRGLSFTFDKSNGDLVDLHGDEGADESAVSALADDAKDYAGL